MRHLWIPCVVAAAAALTGCQQKNGDFSMRQLLARVKGPNERQLVKQMFESEDPDLRRSALEQLARDKNRRRDPYLKGYAALTRDPDPTVRSAAVRALGLGRDPRYVDQLGAALKDRDRTVRWDAAVALDAVVGKGAVKPLAFAALNDEDADVRAAAAGALRNYPRGDVVETLVRCLDDPELLVRFKAAESLTELTGEQAGTDPGAWREALSAKPDLFAASAKPRKPWWDLLGVTEPKPPRPKPAASGSGGTKLPAAAAASGPDAAKRPWWDLLGVTKPKEPKGPARAKPAVAKPEKPKGRSVTDLAAEAKKPKRPWWDLLGVTKPKEPKGKSVTELAAEGKQPKPDKGRSVTDLAAEAKTPKRPWWDLLGVTKPKEPKAQPAK